MSDSIILSGMVSAFSLFTANDIYCHWQKIEDLFINQTLILLQCNFYEWTYSGWEYF